MNWWCRAVLVLVLGLLLPYAVSPAETEAAWDPEGEVGEASYEVVPSQGKVHVTLTFTLTNLDREARSQGGYYRPWSTLLPNEATDVRIYDAERPLRIISTTPEEFWTRYKYEFNKELWYGASYSYTVEFDLPVDGNTASFTAWGYTNTATIKIVVPTGYHNEVNLSKEGYSLSTTGTHTVYTYDVPQDGRQFYTRVTAFRTTEYQSISGTAELKEKTPSITVEFWEGEEGKANHILSLYQAALPVMEGLWGIPFPPGYAIIVREGTEQDTEGFAGHNSGRQGITVVASYMERDATLLHELAHYWANRPPFAEKWMWEGYATLHGYLTLRALGDDQAAKDYMDGRAGGYQSRKAECDFPLAEWTRDTSVGSCATELGYGKSAVFLQDLYGRSGMPTFKEVNGMVFSWEQDVDWFDYLHILETATGQELGRTFVGWVVPQSFGTSFQQWQSAERGYWATQGEVAESKGALGINEVERYLVAAKTLIKDGDFSKASDRVAFAVQLYEQWQTAYNAYQEAKAALATAADTLGVKSVEQSLSRTKTSLTRGEYGAASSRAQMTLSLFSEWQAALRAFRDGENSIGQPADTLGFQTVQDELDEAQSLLTSGQFSQVGAQVDSTLSLFKEWQQARKAVRDAENTIGQPADTLGFQTVQDEMDEAQSLLSTGQFSQVGTQVDATLSVFGEWQQALKTFRDAENTIGQPADTLGFQTVQDEMDEAQSLLTSGQFSQVAAQVDATLSAFGEWQQALKTFRDAESTIGQPADALGFQAVRDGLYKARSLLTGGQFSQVATQADATLSLFKEWQQALKAFRDAEATIGQPSDTLGFQTVQDEMDEAQSLLSGGQFSQVAAQTYATLSVFGEWQQALKAFRDAEATIGQPSDTLGFQTVQDEMDKARSLLSSGQFTETIDQVNSTLAMFSQWQEAVKSLGVAEASVAQAKAEGRTWNLSSAETTLTEARDLLSAGALGKSLAQSRVTEETAVAAVTPLRAIAPYVGLALAVLGALVGGMLALRRVRRRPLAG